MKIQVNLLESNPFRRMEHYPINPAKVAALKNSIRETGFWDNIVVRKHPKKEGKFQIAYGHHRLQAVKEAGLTEVNIPVRDLDDIAMIRIMANENMDEWKSNVAVTNETVLTAKEFIEAEVKRAGRNWRQLHSEIQKLWPTGEKAFLVSVGVWDAKGNSPNFRRGGPGSDIIRRFLGSNWDHNVIDTALSLLNDPEIDREAVEEFKSPLHAETFRKAVKNINERAGSEVIPKEKQKALAQTIKKEIAEEAAADTGKTKEPTAEKIQHKVYQKFADTVKPPEQITKKDAMSKLLPAEEFKEWAAWLSICSKIKDRHPIANMSKRAKEEIKKLIRACSDEISAKGWEVE